MIVTGIERQKRQRDRVNVYVDGIFAFGLHAEVLGKYGLRKGDEVDEQTLHAITSAEEINLAKQKAFRLLSYRMRSEHELRTRLREKEFQPKTIDSVIEHLQSVGFLDDRAFALSFVHDAQLRKPAGKRLLTQQLRKKGISGSIIAEVLAESVTNDSEVRRALEAATKILERHRTSRKTVPAMAQQKRVADFLARRGFEWAIISTVLRTLFKHDTHTNEEA